MKSILHIGAVAAMALMLTGADAKRYKCRNHDESTSSTSVENTESSSVAGSAAGSSGSSNGSSNGSESTNGTASSTTGSYTGGSGSAWDWKTQKSYGVNIGNWLVLEAWMDQSWFNSVANGGSDEWTLCQNNGGNAASILQKHWDSWLTEDDIAGLAKQGINMLRVPVGFWAFIPTTNGEPYVTSGQKPQLERILGYAAKYNMHVIVDLHGLPGSQNGNDHSGHSGSIEFYTAENQRRSIETVQAVVDWAKTAKNKERIAAIQSANEPKANSDQDFNTLKDFYTKANTIINNAGWPMMFHDAFRGISAWNDFLTNGENAILDVHPYWAFSGPQTKEGVIGGVCSYGSQFKNYHLPVFAGEFSVASNGINEDSSWYRRFYDSQISQWVQSAGGTFWSFKTANGGPWSFMSLVGQGNIDFHPPPNPLGSIPSNPTDTSQSAC